MKKFGRIFSFALTAVAAMGLAACGGKGDNGDKGNAPDVTVYAPDGAPALAIAKMLAEDTADDGVTYKVVQAA